MISPTQDEVAMGLVQVGVAVELGNFPLESLLLVAGLGHVDRFNTVLPWSLFVDPCCASGNKTG